MTDMKPLFSVGSRGDISGFQWRVDRGTKSPDDLVILTRCPNWIKPKMAVSFLLADFHFQAEDILYPPTAGYLGGERFMNFVRAAVDVGWEWPTEHLEFERLNSRRNAA